jgi:hypothetical protein
VGRPRPSLGALRGVAARLTATFSRCVSSSPAHPGRLAQP